LWGLRGPDSKLRAHIKKNNTGQIRVCLDQISSTYDEVAAKMNEEGGPNDYKQFITRSRRGTTDTGSRIERTNFVCGKLLKYLNK
jgi:hypothetical protein